ncbi:type II toxin-antitoxin system RelE/ParE family toxin [Bifidobacterium panos]|uniref:type II toxin-antitoxin system RelE/ParE family toxin n=1 Tax=Bifidobacterium panos TaxID=2675321 RepID=UPI0026575A9D|nr:type II toxin-antitoxin system RelE/ParE family toxin [Bifidobacterium sp. DSM 109963]
MVPPIARHQRQSPNQRKTQTVRDSGQPTVDLHPVGGGVSELRFHFGSGYRVYFAQKGDTLMLLLAGGDKSGQSRDVKRAQRMLDQLRKDKQW